MASPAYIHAEAGKTAEGEAVVDLFLYRFEVSWGPAELYERKYLHDRRPDTFYHPVKHLGIVDGL